MEVPEACEAVSWEVGKSLEAEHLPTHSGALARLPNAVQRLVVGKGPKLRYSLRSTFFFFRIISAVYIYRRREVWMHGHTLRSFKLKTLTS